MEIDALDRLGWSPAWAAARAQAQALMAPRMAAALPQPYRLARLHKSQVQALGAAGMATLTIAPPLSVADLAVGDWVLAAQGRIIAVLPAQTQLLRRAAGTGGGLQKMAANVDVMLIVTACGGEFNPARLERYLVLAHASGIPPVVILTKADLLDPAPFAAAAQACAPGTPVLVLNAKTDAPRLAAHIGPGKTAVLMGSSGVGKSTLANGLLGGQIMPTGPVRSADDRGRHTTTTRHLLALPQGGWLIDTPGLRELHLADAAAGIDILFADITALAPECRFRNCQHLSEPGCAVQSAITSGRLAPDRLQRWRKLQSEQRVKAHEQQLTQTRSAGRQTRKSASKHQPVVQIEGGGQD